MALEQQIDKKWKTLAPASKEVESVSGGFDCNICLDFASDPVVTLCGHLYCWPCIYKWFYIQSASLPSDEYPQCPVCKAEISHTTVIPLYGRGDSISSREDDAKSTSPDTVIPPRPPACGTRALLQAASQPEHHLRPYGSNPYQSHPHYSPEEMVSSSSLFDHTSDAVANVFQPVVGMFGEMVYARVFGNSQSLYTYPNSYHLVGSSSPRLRRQEMQVDKSLSRISLFLLCCFLLCLLLF